PGVERDDLGDERLELDAPVLDEAERAAPGARRGREARGDDELLLEDGVERDRHRLPEDADLDVPSAAAGGAQAGSGPAGAARALDDDVEAVVRVNPVGERRLEAEPLRRGQPQLVAGQSGDEHP